MTDATETYIVWYSKTKTKRSRLNDKELYKNRVSFKDISFWHVFEEI